MNTIAEQVTNILAEQTCRPATEIQTDHDFTNDLACDSLDKVEIVMALEEEFEIIIEDKQAELIQTVQQAIDYVEAKTAKIEVHAVESSQMQAIGHAGRTLAVQFKNGTYHYPGFTAEEFQAFKCAPSLGSYFGKLIKLRPLYFKL